MGLVGGRRFEGSVKFADGKNFMLDLIPAQQPIKNQHQILWCGYQHVITSRPITALVFMRRPAFFCFGVNALVRTKRDGKNVRLRCE